MKVCCGHGLRQRIRRALVLAMGAVLAACAPVGPDYQPPPSAMPAAWQANTKQLTFADNLETLQWWRLFQDTTLEQLLTQARAANLDLRMAETRIREARALRQAVAANALPAIDTTGSYSTTRRSENIASGGTTQDLFQLGFDASWELDLFGGLRRQAEAAQANLEAAAENRYQVLLSLSAEVARNYLELRANQQRQAIARDNIRIQEQTAALVQSKFDLGLGSELEVVQTATLLTQTQAEIPTLESDAARNTHQLALLLGLQPKDMDQLLAGAGTIPPVPPQLPVALPSSLLRQRPDIRTAERQLAASTATVGAAVAELYPRFSLSTLLGLQSRSLSDLIRSSSTYWTAGPSVRWSLFDAGQTRAGIAVSEARRDLAQATYEKTILSALGETEDALVVLDREQERRRLLAKSTQSAQQAVLIAKGQYKAGLTTFLNVLQGEAALYQLQDKLAQSDLRLAMAMVALYKALGGGWLTEAETAPPQAPQPSLQD